MTDAQRIERVKSYFDPNTEGLTDEVASFYLDSAKDTVLLALYPFSAHFPEDAEVPLRYEGVWCELAARMFSRRGGLGETMHIENGIHRDWYSSDDSDLLRKIVPLAIVR
nr:MAG TPA: hypothetical protein [Bacteriophage sp.]